MTNLNTGKIRVITALTAAFSLHSLHVSSQEYMYVANYFSNNVNIIDVNTQTITGTVAVGGAPKALALGGTGMYVTSLDNDNVNIIDIINQTIAGTVGVGLDPRALALAGTGMYVANSASNNVNIIDLLLNML